LKFCLKLQIIMWYFLLCSVFLNIIFTSGTKIQKQLVEKARSGVQENVLSLVKVMPVNDLLWWRPGDATHHRTCPLTKLDGGLHFLHEADKAAVDWLKNYRWQHTNITTALCLNSWESFLILKWSLNRISSALIQIVKLLILQLSTSYL